MRKNSLIRLSVTDEPRFSYLRDITGQQFDDSTGLIWLQALPLGKYEHPLHGTLDITPQKIGNFVKNFNDKVRETDLDVDYDHKLLDTKAAGWIQAMEDRGSAGLWIGVDFTQPARDALKNKEYRYFSSEFQDSWKSPKSGQTFTDVMFGGALTNRPFIKDILPINLNDFIIQPTETGEDMALDPKLKSNLIKLYQLSETATDEEVTAAVEAEAEAPEEEVEDEETEEDESTEDEETAQLSELLEAYPALKKLTERNKTMEEQIATLGLANKLSETTVKLNALSEKGKFAIPPALVEQARELAIQLNEGQTSKLFSLLENFTKTGVVDLGERGRTREGDGGKSLSEIFTADVVKMSEESKITFGEAAILVAAADPAGFAAYRDEATNRN